jgi:hypothetical protein
MSVRRSAWFASLLAGLILLTGVVACGNGDRTTSTTTTSSSTSAPASAVITTVATPVDADFSVTGIDPSHLCFDASTLPANFVADGDGVLGTATDAAAGSGDPTQRAQELMNWGYVTGAYSQWSFSPPSAQTKEQQQTLPAGTVAALRTAETGERQSTPYFSALCRVSVYQHTDGARQAFASMHDDVKSTVPLPAPNAAVRDGDATNIGNESASYFIDASGYGTDAVVFRAGNIVGEALVTYSCNQGCAQTGSRLEQEAVRLATLENTTLDHSLSR